MREALAEAQKAYQLDEVPIGAVVVKNGEVIGRGHNLRESKKDPTLHAEIIAIRQAAAVLGGWRLTDCDLYVTIEPCPMCAGAILQARIRRLIFGARDPKAGCAGSLYNLLEDTRFNHRTEVTEGILKDSCSLIIKEYFRQKRNKLV
ncbi:MAG: tRNA adenosine(34) deaminase TadA [Caldicoprobacterales bacterium]|jgi:tRNA(adenine34) deaminase|nr:tRNA adenosine(34) deaminase TadA [Bacteroidales bacterium]